MYLAASGFGRNCHAQRRQKATKSLPLGTSGRENVTCSLGASLSFFCISTRANALARQAPSVEASSPNFMFFTQCGQWQPLGHPFPVLVAQGQVRSDLFTSGFPTTEGLTLLQVSFRRRGVLFYQDRVYLPSFYCIRCWSASSLRMSLRSRTVMVIEYGVLAVFALQARGLACRWKGYTSCMISRQ